MIQRKRLELFCNYVNEANAKKGLPAQPASQMNGIYHKRKDAAATEWIDIHVNNQDKDPIGFLLLNYAPKCNPYAHICIEDAYIEPAYRGQGHMKKALGYFLENNPGHYCLLILRDDQAAHDFWHHVFAQFNYEPVEMTDACTALEGYKQYAFEKPDRA